MRLGLVLLLLLISLPVNADGYSEAQNLYSAGQYQRAAEQARQLGTADGFALAARAELVVAAYIEAERDLALLSLEQAARDAQNAIVLDPTHIEGRLQAAIAQGYQARIERSPSLARDAKALIDDVLSARPDHAYALATLGGWHGETIATIGGFLAALTTGASKKEFMQAFDAALEADKDNPAIRAYYARILLDIGGKKFERRAEEVLDEAISLHPRDAFEAMLQEGARRLRTAYESGDKATLKETLQSLTPFS